MDRLRKEKQERVEQAQKGFEETKVLPLEVGKLYRLTITRAWGKQSDDEKGDFMGFSFTPESPICKGFKRDGENTIYMRKGVMRTFVSRVLRGLPPNESYPELEAGFAKGEPLMVKVPTIPEAGLNVQFSVVEDPPKGGYANGFKHVFGETVEKFPKSWDDIGAFVDRIKKERDDYMKSRMDESRAEEEDDAGKIGHKEMGVNKPIHMVVTRAYAQKGDSPSFMIFRIDPARSKLWDGYNADKDGKKNRVHMSALTLKTFISNVLALPPKNGGAMVQVGFDKDKKQPEYVQVPEIPVEGVEVRFFRQERQSENFSWKECLGEKL